MLGPKLVESVYDSKSVAAEAGHRCTHAGAEEEDTSVAGYTNYYNLTYNNGYVLWLVRVSQSAPVVYLQYL